MSMDILTVRGFLVFRPIADTMGLQAEYAAELKRRKESMEALLSKTPLPGLTSVEILVFAEKPTLMYYVNINGFCLIVTSTPTDLVQMRVILEPDKDASANPRISDQVLKDLYDTDLRRFYDGFLDKIPE